jgi:hypothetical protein
MIKNIDYELHTCSRFIDIKKPYQLAIIDNEHHYYKTTEKHLYNSFARASTGSSQVRKRRIHLFYNFEQDVDSEGNHETMLVDMKQYPDSRKFFLANYKPTKNEAITNIADIYNTMEE